MTVEVEREEDGRWIAEVPAVPGALAYGESRTEAVSRAQSIALRAIADRLDAGDPAPETEDVFAVGP